MKFIADENIPRSLVNLLRQRGNDVLYIREGKRGLPDSEICKLSLKEERIIITSDKDFGYLIYRSNLAVSGVILIRILKLEKQKEFISGLLRKYNEKIPGSFIVIDNRGIRSRKLLKKIH